MKVFPCMVVLIIAGIIIGLGIYIALHMIGVFWVTMIVVLYLSLSANILFGLLDERKLFIWFVVVFGIVSGLLPRLVAEMGDSGFIGVAIGLVGFPIGRLLSKHLVADYDDYF